MSIFWGAIETQHVCSILTLLALGHAPQLITVPCSPILFTTSMVLWSLVEYKKRVCWSPRTSCLCDDAYVLGRYRNTTHAFCIATARPSACAPNDHTSLQPDIFRHTRQPLQVRCSSRPHARPSLPLAICLPPHPCRTPCLDASHSSSSRRWLWFENHISVDSSDRTKSLARAGAAVACTGARVVASQPDATRLSVACVLVAGTSRALVFY